jgi:predicted ribonuclease YlaK
MKKTYVIDTNVLLDDPSCIKTLRNGEENNIVLPWTVISELDRLKRDPKKRELVIKAADAILEELPNITVTGKVPESNDVTILKEIIDSKIEDPILVTNDHLLRVVSLLHGIKGEEYRSAKPIQSESEKYTGYIQQGEEPICNSFEWIDGKPYYHSNDGKRVIDYEHTIWKVKPRSMYQNLAFELMLDPSLDLVTLQSNAGYGKAQPVSSQILTPNGWINMGDIEIGDIVFDRNGKPTKVVSVYEQNIKDVYEVTMSDGSKTRCCKEHLWIVQNIIKRYDSKRKMQWDTLSLEEISNKITGRKEKIRRYYYIPLTDGVQFEEKSLPIHPYLLGVLLGDGGLTYQPNITTTDEFILNECKPYLPEGTEFRAATSGSITYAVAMIKKTISGKKGIYTNQLTRILNQLGLIKINSHNKFIPDVYKLSSVKDRISLLQGLMDTDGTINKKNHALSITTVSDVLKNDIKFIIQSLGGTCRVYSGFVKFEDKKFFGYTITMMLPKTIHPFRLPRKNNLWMNIKDKKLDPFRCIDCIEYVGKEACRCIRVDSETQSYLTEEFIVTHNTFLALSSAMSLVLEKKQFEKIYVIKSPIEIGPAMGFLPGDAMDKLEPYIRPIYDLVHKLHGLRPAKRLYENEQKKEFDRTMFEVLPLAYIRGMNIDDAVVIVDETQNISRSDLRALLTRMGENVKCICLGDTNQVDNPYLNSYNNGLNWIVTLCKNQKNYGHLVLKGAKSRGPVTDLILKVGL